ncbi:MAG: hypothetical protein IAG10_10570 [Planctomycetaceae bacterium]|nr:hypothetical protein [Planctomycetaceae bacterium]
MVELADAVIASGWIGRNVTAGCLTWPEGGGDLLPLLTEAAQSGVARAKNAREQRQAANVARLLAWSRRGEAMLTLSWPQSEDQSLERWLGPRLLWWPRGVPEGRKVAWVSSRLGRAIDERPDWFAVLRSAAAKLDPARDVLLTAPSTTVDRFLERAAILFGLRRLRVNLDERRTLVDWLTRLRRQLWRSCLAHEGESLLTGRTEMDTISSEVFVSPVISPGADATRLAKSSGVGELPLSDRVLIAAANQVLALQVRSNGNLHQLLRARLTDSAWPTASVWLALGEALVPSEVASELQSLGAVGWWLFVEHVSNVLDPPRRTGTLETCSTMTELPWPDGDYLVHWTRRRDGPWPGQSEAEFIDELLLRRESTSHSAFAALSRIVQLRRVIASAAGIRGSAAVVSFSSKPLHELTEQRAFRAHRGRWDCESYGLCLKRDWLQSLGAKPVIYGDDAQWLSLPECDRPFFQLRTTRSRHGTKTIDWSEEAEWRVPQDVDLTTASRDDVLLFVPTTEEAQQLAAISPWPVLACKEPRRAR